jgi:tRNA U34 5-methylaminomethyl-2-thiouridine-forming methyltransferase MnmC
MEIKVIISEDGSSTLYLPVLNETYHSLHGAIRESEHVFIKSGLEYVLRSKSKITILEIGFGTGLNVLLTLLAARKHNLVIDYYSIEAFPLSDEIVAQLNYVEVMGDQSMARDFLKLHSCPWNVKEQISDNFMLTKILSKLEEADLENINVDLVYFDAFAPSKQPEMWSEENFKKIKAAMNDQGVLVSYCASGQFKRTLKSLGFQLEALQGPPGKKEMTRGVKNNVEF